MEKLTDDEIEGLIAAMWALTVNERGVPYQGESRNGQFALDMVAKILGAALVLKLKMGDVVSLEEERAKREP